LTIFIISSRVDLYRNLSEMSSSYEMICCGGVLEHLILRDRLQIYDFVKSHLLPGGHFVVQVPIMTGLGMLMRHAARQVLKRGQTHLERIPFLELFLAGVFCRVIDDRGRFDPLKNDAFLTHRGFSHSRLFNELENRFTVTEAFCGPIRMPAYFSHSFYAVLRANHR